MKKVIVSLFSLFLLIGLTLMLSSSSSNPPNGKTGAPSEGTCADCHSMNGGGFAGMIEIDGLPSLIDAGEIYSLTITTSFTNGSPVRAGFQITGLDGSNNQAGSMSNNSGGTTITNSGGRQYLEHSPAENFNGGSSVSWTVDWTAPDGPNGDPISFYAASVIGSGNNGNQSDDVVTTSVSGTLNVMVELMESWVIEQSDVSCFGEQDGYALVEVTGGVPPYEFLWSNGETTNPAVGLPPGTNSIEVSDQDGNSVEYDVLIGEPAELLITNVDVIDNNCVGEEEGSISLEVMGGTGAYEYMWDNGEFGATIEFLPEGDYSVTITDENECMVTGTWSIQSLFTNPFPEILGPDELCEGQEAELALTESYVSYDWSTGENTAFITIDFPGTYSVTVEDDNGCMGEAFINVFEADLPLAEIEEIERSICQGEGFVVLGASENNLEYMWSTGESSQFIEVVAEGTYSLTVTNQSGCEASNVYDVEFPDFLNALAVVQSQNMCFGDNAAYVVVNAEGGQAPYTLSWTDPLTMTTDFYNPGDTVFNLSTGEYLLIAEDAYECLDSFLIEITEPALLVSNLIFSGETESGLNDGQASLNPQGGSMPYSVLWSTGETGNSIGNLSPGNYGVTITDANDCVLAENFTINPGDCMLEASYSVDSVTCFANDDGNIEIVISGGTEPYLYTWSTGENTETGLLENVGPGVYSVTVEDAGNCILSFDEISVSEPDELLGDLFFADETLQGANDGVASVEISGGTSPYEIIWSNGENGTEILNLSPGEYSVLVSDVNGCAWMSNFIILEGAAIDADGDGFGADVDCNDNDPNINPDADEIPNNDVDENCDDIILIIDEDGDGFNSDDDCDDMDPDINPDADEIPNNGIDEDCDGEDGTTSTSDLSLNEIRIYPNPSKGILYIDFPDYSQLELQLYSFAGEALKLEIRGNEVDLSGLPKGLYLLKIRDRKTSERAVKRISIIE